MAAPSGPNPAPALGINGPLVKRLRHRPFTAVTRVRVPYGSPIWRLSSAGRALASHARGHRFEFCSLHHKGCVAKRKFCGTSFVCPFLPNWSLTAPVQPGGRTPPSSPWAQSRLSRRMEGCFPPPSTAFPPHPAMLLYGARRPPKENSPRRPSDLRGLFGLIPGMVSELSLCACGQPQRRP